jgi:hypothetical protein
MGRTKISRVSPDESAVKSLSLSNFYLVQDKFISRHYNSIVVLFFILFRLVFRFIHISESITSCASGAQS